MFEYIPRNSVIHRLDPRTKFFWLIGITIAAVCINKPVLLLLLFFLTLSPLVLAKIPAKQFILIGSFYVFIFVGTTLSQALFYSPIAGTQLTVLFWILPPDFPLLGPATGGIPFTLEGALYGFIQAFRVLSMLNASVTLVLTTPLNRMVCGLRELHVPYLLTFMITTAVRFVPTLMEELRMITHAIRSRGIAGNPFRIVFYAMSPLILNSVRRCNQLSLAAECRGFGTLRTRTYYTKILWKPFDTTATLMIAAIVSGLLYLNFIHAA
jgi:energy-coupling factor transport system permease protein